MTNVSDEAKLCLECGSLSWSITQSSSVYGRVSYFPRDDNGRYNDSFDRDDDGDDDWNDSGDPECSECGGTDLEDISNLTTQQFQLIYHLEDEARPAALALLREGKEVDPETGEEVTPSDTLRKGKLIGKRVHQH